MRWLPWLGALLALTWAPAAAAARELEQDVQLWTMFSTTYVHDAGRVELVPYLELQARFDDGMRELSLLQGRAAFFVRPVEELWLGGGLVYGTTFRERSTRREWRPYEEVQWQPELLDGAVTLIPRVRLEHRFIQGVDAVSHRFRLRFGAEVGLFEVQGVQVDLELSYEVFANLNDVRDGPRQGLDQQRAYAGLIFRLTEAVDVEVGYQAQHVNERGARDELNHELWLSVQLQFGD
ncbi:MAG: DUF2490 domain-containing protein [Planctomycetes bacterium]|nr:DUF2490 domain-containing protein [Planctomycetota bacterium]